MTATPARRVLDWPQPHEPATYTFECPTCGRALAQVYMESVNFGFTSKITMLAPGLAPRMGLYPGSRLPWYGRPSRDRGGRWRGTPHLPLVVRCDCGTDVICRIDSETKPE